MELGKLICWLSTFPGFQAVQWETDCLPHKPNMATLIPKGITTVDTIEDVLGNWKKTLRFTCTVAFSGQNMAQTLWQLQHWVEDQSARGCCPQLGQGRKAAALREGKHLTKNKLGLDLYTAQLTLTYERYYEVNEHGED